MNTCKTCGKEEPVIGKIYTNGRLSGRFCLGHQLEPEGWVKEFDKEFVNLHEVNSWSDEECRPRNRCDERTDWHGCSERVKSFISSLLKREREFTHCKSCRCPENGL